MRSKACLMFAAILPCAPALGQDALANVEEAELLSESVGPGETPGRELAPRTRPAPAATESAVAPPETREWFGGAAWWEWSRVSGDWGGARTTLESWGIDLGGSYTLDWSSVWSGGIENRASTRTALSLNATLDLDALVGLPGGSVFIDFLSSDMRGGSRDAGDFHSISDIETGRNVDQISELWYEQTLFDGILRAKVGKIDANAEFGFPAIGADFLNGADVLSPTAYLANPTWPNPAMGAVLFAYPTEQIYVGAGFFDGGVAVGRGTGRNGPRELFKGDEFHWIGEAGYSWSEVASLGQGRIAGGGWYNSGAFDRFDGGTERGTHGWYAVAEQQLIRRAGWEDTDDPRGLFAFLQYGWGEEDLNPAANHAALGVVARGTFEGRDDDGAGIYLSWVDLSDDDAAGFPEDEYLIDAFYRVQLTGWMTVQPTIQYVGNPAGSDEVDDAVVGAVRFEITF